ncbi:hypothetical protein G6F59_015968 [Rhizopus arrhizus]|nr:hypothetical protein G6F59_015968 [Rhizopus arrhizus]
MPPRELPSPTPADTRRHCNLAIPRPSLTHLQCNTGLCRPWHIDYSTNFYTRRAVRVAPSEGPKARARREPPISTPAGHRSPGHSTNL